MLSMLRMFISISLSIAIAITVGVIMARNQKAEKLLYPIIDVLQSVPILGFFPFVLMLFVNLKPQWLGPELASIILIFTSQSWNLILGVYSSVKVIPQDIIDMSEVFGLSKAAKFFKIYIPFAMPSIARNLIISWAGGLFFLTASEVIILGSTQYTLTGIGTYIQMAANAGNFSDVILGIIVLIISSILTYVFIWNPFFETIAKGFSGYGTFEVFSSYLIYKPLSKIVSTFYNFIAEWAIDINSKFKRYAKIGFGIKRKEEKFFYYSIALLIAMAGLYLIWQYTKSSSISLSNFDLGKYLYTGFFGLFLTLARIIFILLGGTFVILAISYYLYDRRPIYKAIFTLLGEIMASVPAVLWWGIFDYLIRRGFPPIITMFIIFFQGSIWYVFFNVFLTGIGPFEKNLMEMANIYKIKGIYKFRYVFVPLLAPYLVSGLASGWGGAWNAAIIAEFAQIGGTTLAYFGIGYLISLSTYLGDETGLTFYVLFLSLFIVIINRTAWKMLYNYMKKKYHIID